MPGLDVARLRSEFQGPHDLVPTSDGQVLFVRRWEADGKSEVSVLIFHGITAYSGPYGRLIAAPLTAAGFSVLGLDLRGHGLSDGVRGDYPSRERWERDIAETVAYVRTRARKLVVLGHSLGALSAILAAKVRPDDLSGLILLGAGPKIRVGPYRRPSAAAQFRALLGVAILRGRPLIEYRREGMTGLDDPLFNFRYSARFYTIQYGVGALRLQRMLREGVLDSPNLRFGGKVRIPLLVGVGDQDELIPIESARALCDSIDCDNKEFLVLPGTRHAIVPPGALVPVQQWLARRE